MSTNIAYEIWAEGTTINFRILSQTEKFWNKSSTGYLVKVCPGNVVVSSRGVPSLRLDDNDMLFVNLRGSVSTYDRKICRLHAKSICHLNELVKRIHEALASWSSYVDSHIDCELDNTLLGEHVK